MSRRHPLRLLLVIAALAVATIASPVSADHEDECEKQCDEETTTTTEREPEPTTTTTADDDEVATTTTKPEPESTTTTTTWRRWRTTTTTTTTTAPAPVFVGGGGSTSGSQPSTFSRTGQTTTSLDDDTTSEPSTTTTLDPLTYEPVELPTTTRPPVDRSDLETALASTDDSGSRRSSIFGVSDTVIALVLGALAVALLGTGGIRRWLDRT